MNNLRNLRKREGLSIAEINKRTGIPVRTLEDWDTEKRVPNSYHRIRVLSDLLNCSTDDFMRKEVECLYNSKEAFVSMVQEDKDVHVEIINEKFKIINDFHISRDVALELLQHLKKESEIVAFLQKHNVTV